MVFTHLKNNGVSSSKKNNAAEEDRLNNISGIAELLFEGLSSLERGMFGLDRDISTPVGKIDIMAVDMIGRFVIIEVGEGDVDGLIFKSIDHFDWALTNIKSLQERYKSYNTDPTLAPRIIILAPSYSEKFVKRAHYLNPTFIDIYEYQINENLGTKKIYFRPFSFINHKKWVISLRTKSVNDHLDYIENEFLKSMLKNFFIELQSIRSDTTLDTSLGYVRLKDKSDKTLLGIYILKNAFWINWIRDRWDGCFISSKEKFQAVKRDILEAIRKEA
ncbi:MAG: hypothetical protein P9X27_06350 [Candidatus Kaelpia aquatica]|nr:hypothetical protein [Candidatus Kaelpia aquatica]